MKEKLWGCAVVSVNGKIYVFCENDTYDIHESGGQIDKDEGYLSSIEVFDTMIQKWSHFPSMTTK